MKIYTKTGDGGDTSLFGGGRVGKESDRVESYGQIDELNSVLGMARAEGLGALDELTKALQDQLFTIGSILATPAGSKAAAHIPQMKAEWVSAMESAIDGFDQQLPALTSFIIPGGTKAAAALHHARCVCRRAERRIVPLMRAGDVEQDVVVYLNRLSDLLFTMARMANFSAGVKDEPWVAPKA
ncbi:MAG: cob(I)yrinic acid a,c-diamide adenosyltransferase [Myxococcaceae bacterium]|jgi:cob(I)alamin adenosyltransferase|nr:cob(I)yrinic acid a,c-diamide adenosyltransferase [Myxococcaceae bacterium]MCA3014379.1 cob(I)yrinic acid a,c-diamide adenosyltransferase [Myxococcaceae bacterium]